MPAALERCVRHVMDQGEPEDHAWAICNASGAGKLAETATDAEVQECVKAYQATQRTKGKAAAPAKRKVHLVFPITKIDEERREVWGYATVEGDGPDRQGDITEYEGSKQAFAAWSGYFEKISGGQSLGNVREMHRPSAVGKAIAWEPDDQKKAILLGLKVIDDAAWDKTKARVYNGLSIGANPTKEKRERRKGRMVNVIKEYDLVEVSLVDNPANPEAVLTMVKMDPQPAEEGPPPGDSPANYGRDLAAPTLAERFKAALLPLKGKVISETPSILPALRGLEMIAAAIDSELYEAAPLGGALPEGEKADVATLVAAAESLLDFILGEFQEVVRAISAPEGVVTKEAAAMLEQLTAIAKMLTPGALKKVMADEDTVKNLTAMHTMGHALTDATQLMGASCAKGICKVSGQGNEDAADNKPPDKGEPTDQTAPPQDKETGKPSDEEKVAGAGTEKLDAAPDLDKEKAPGGKTDGPEGGAPGRQPAPEGASVGKAAAPAKKGGEAEEGEASRSLRKLQEVVEGAMAAVQKAVASIDARVKRVEDQPASVGRPVAAPVEKSIGGVGGAQDAGPAALSAALNKMAEEEPDPQLKMALSMKAATLGVKAIQTSATPPTRRG